MVQRRLAGRAPGRVHRAARPPVVRGDPGASGAEEPPEPAPSALPRLRRGRGPPGPGSATAEPARRTGDRDAPVRQRQPRPPEPMRDPQPNTRATGASIAAPTSASVEAFLAAASRRSSIRNGAGLSDDLALAPIYERHATLFDRDDGRCAARAVEAGGTEVGRNRALLAFATDGFLERAVGAADRRGRDRREPAPSCGAERRSATGRLRKRISAIERAGGAQRALRSLAPGRGGDQPAAPRATRADPRVAAGLGYCRLRRAGAGRPAAGIPTRSGAQAGALAAIGDAATSPRMRRVLARIGIEQGDGKLADAWHMLRGSGWDAWFDPRRLVAVLEATLRRSGHRAAATRRARRSTSRPRPNKSPRAFCRGRQRAR